MSPSPAEAVHGLNSGDKDLNRRLKLLFNATGGESHVEGAASAALTQQTGMRLDLDPLSYIIPKSKVKYHDIVDIQDMTEEAEEMVLNHREDARLVVKRGPKKLRLENITTAQ